jgi:uncharacterized membrane protein YqhA
VIRALFAGSRFVVGLAVAATFIGSVVLLILSAVAVLRITWIEIASFTFERHTARTIDHLGVQFIEITDTILLGTVMYIVSLGLYQLFIDPTVPVPRWLRVRNLTELKRDLIGVTVVLLGVTFLGEVVDWDPTTPDQSGILFLGAAIALVAASLGLFLWISPRESGREETPLTDAEQ